MNEIDKAYIDSIGETYKSAIKRADLDHTTRYLLNSRKKEYERLGLNPNDPTLWQMKPSELSEVTRVTESQKHLGHPFGSFSDARKAESLRNFVIEISRIDGHDYTQD